jgi:uncharacterized protein (DUF885 family)
MKIHCLVVAFLLTVSSTCAQQVERRPADIEVLFRNFVIEYIDLRPETGSAIGLPAAWGIRVKNNELDDVSDAGTQKVYGLYRKYLNWLTQYDRERLSASQQTASKVFKWFLENELRAEKFRYHYYIISPILGFHNSFVTLMTENHKLESQKDVDDYVERLSRLPTKIDGILEQLEIKKSKGIMPPLYIIEAYQQILNTFVQHPYTDNIIFTSFRDRIDNISGFDDETKQQVRRKVVAALRESVYPSYERIIYHLEGLKSIANGDAGVCRLPEGAEYYEHCLREHTTTTMTPGQVHNLGLAEVERIQGELIAQFKEIGISGCNNFREWMGKYMALTSDKTDMRFYFPAGEQGDLLTVAAYQAIVDTMQMRLPEMFSMMPRTAVKVVRVPHYKEQTIGTYYRPPKLDGSEGGIFYVNLSYQHRKPEMKTLAYHEAIPGHHFQIAIEQEQTDARLFKVLFFFTGYVEGWALYAEKLAKEYGCYNDTYSQIGYLRSELFRALRLVIDTGIHYKKWSRDKAYNYLLNNLGWSSYSQIDRYIVWPGQACAYKIGELKILELREHARKMLGRKFDIKEFHNVVLQHGSVPLAILEQLVDDYIESSKT